MLPHYILLYDGKCRICTAQANKLLTYDDDQRFTLLDLNDQQCYERFPEIAYVDAQRWMHVVSPNRQIYRGADAVRQALLLLPRWRFAGALLYFPGLLQLARPLYDWFARNRYRFGGYTTDACADGACAVHFGKPSNHTAQQ